MYFYIILINIFFANLHQSVINKTNYLKIHIAVLHHRLDNRMLNIFKI